jgi:hypothetical protein
VEIKLQHAIWVSPKASQKLKFLGPVFKRLVSIHEHFVQVCGDDYWPYWYGERPQIGFLATAVWLEKGVALEEHSVKRLKERKFKRGRNDLYINIDKALFECEAKRVSLNLGGNTKAGAAKVSKALDWAIDDVKHLDGKKGLALCFVTLQILRKKSSDMEPKLRRLMDLVRKKSDALVWIGVHDVNKLPGENWLYPGLLLAIAEK